MLYNIYRKSCSFRERAIFVVGRFDFQRKHDIKGCLAVWVVWVNLKGIFRIWNDVKWLDLHIDCAHSKVRKRQLGSVRLIYGTEKYNPTSIQSMAVFSSSTTIASILRPSTTYTALSYFRWMGLRKSKIRPEMERGRVSIIAKRTGRNRRTRKYSLKSPKASLLYDNSCTAVTRDRISQPIASNKIRHRNSSTSNQCRSRSSFTYKTLSLIMRSITEGSHMTVVRYLTRKKHKQPGFWKTTLVSTESASHDLSAEDAPGMNIIRSRDCADTQKCEIKPDRGPVHSRASSKPGSMRGVCKFVGVKVGEVWRRVFDVCSCRG